MSRASIPAAEWIAEHEQSYGLLFDDGSIQNKTELTELPNGAIALSALKRFGPVIKKPSTNFQTISRGVAIVLQACSDGKLGDQNTLIQDMPVSHLAAVKDDVADIIDQWERCCFYWRYPSPFFESLPNFQPDPEDKSAELALLTTASLLQVEPGILRGKPVPIWAKKGIQFYGPQFTENLLESRPLPGHPIDEYTTHPSLDPAAKKFALTHYPMPGSLGIILKNLAYEANPPFRHDLDALQDER